MAERYVIVRVDDVINAPAYAIEEAALAGATARCRVDGDSRAVMLLVAEISPEAIQFPKETCRDVLRAALESNGVMTRDALIEHCAPTFLPTQVISEMSDAIADGWLRSNTHEGVVSFELCSVVPQIPPDPLAEAFVPFTPIQRLDQAQADISALLEQLLGDRAGPTAIHHLAAANYHLHQLRVFI